MELAQHAQSTYNRLNTPGNCLSTLLYHHLYLPTIVLYIKKNPCHFFKPLALIFFSSYFCFILCVFCIVITIISTALHYNALVYLYLLYSTLLPWAEVK